MTNARIRSPLARASLIDARNSNERNDQIFANTLSAYTYLRADAVIRKMWKRIATVFAELYTGREFRREKFTFCHVTRHVFTLMSELKSVTDAPRGA